MVEKDASVGTQVGLEVLTISAISILMGLVCRGLKDVGNKFLDTQCGQKLTALSKAVINEAQYLVITPAICLMLLQVYYSMALDRLIVTREIDPGATNFSTWSQEVTGSIAVAEGSAVSTHLLGMFGVAATAGCVSCCQLRVRRVDNADQHERLNPVSGTSAFGSSGA